MLAWKALQTPGSLSSSHQSREGNSFNYYHWASHSNYLECPTFAYGSIIEPTCKKVQVHILVTCLEVGFVNLITVFLWEIGSFKVQIPRFLFKWSSTYMIDLTILIKCINHYIYFYFHMHTRRDRCCGD